MILEKIGIVRIALAQLRKQGPRRAEILHLLRVEPRLRDQHHAMVSAALAVGAHVYCEKPFMRTLAEADDVLAICRDFDRYFAAPAAPADGGAA